MMKLPLNPMLEVSVTLNLTLAEPKSQYCFYFTDISSREATYYNCHSFQDGSHTSGRSMVIAILKLSAGYTQTKHPFRNDERCSDEPDDLMATAAAHNVCSECL